MAKTISNKKYEEFWNNDNLEIKSDDKNNNLSEQDIKKQVKKEVKKEVKKLEEQVKDLTEKIQSVQIVESVESVENNKKRNRTKKTKLNNTYQVIQQELITDISNTPLIINEENNEQELITDISNTPLVIDEENNEENNEENEIDNSLINDEKNIESEIKEEIKEEISIKILSNKELYESYTIDNTPYKIYFRGNLIFNSINHSEKPSFLEDGFILFGKKYIYRGIRFEKY